MSTVTPRPDRGGSRRVGVLAVIFIAGFIAYTLFVPDGAYYRFVSVILGVGAIIGVSGFFLAHTHESLSSLRAVRDAEVAADDTTGGQWPTWQRAVIEAIRLVDGHGRGALKNAAGVVRSLGIGDGRWLADPHLEWTDDTTVLISETAVLTDRPTGVFVYLGHHTPTSNGRGVVYVFAFGDPKITEGIPAGQRPVVGVFRRMAAYANV
jgi:hypothetical protein